MMFQEDFDRRLATLEAHAVQTDTRYNQLVNGLELNTAVTTNTKLSIDSMRTDVSDLVQILQTTKSLMKFITWVAQISKIITAIGAAAALVYFMIKGRPESIHDILK